MTKRKRTIQTRITSLRTRRIRSTLPHIGDVELYRFLRGGLAAK